MPARRTIIFLVVSIIPAAAPAAQSNEEKLAAEMFGRRIAAAKATPSDADDVELARLMLIGANDEGYSSAMRLVLARRAMELLTPLGTSASVDLAGRAFKLIGRISPPSPAFKAAFERDIALGRLARARRDRKGAAELKRLAQQAVEAHLAFVRAAMNDADLADRLNSSLRAARALIKTYKLSEQDKALAELERQFRETKNRAGRLAEAQARLRAARKSGSPAAVRAASIAAAQVYLELDGDVESAARYLAGTGDAKERPIAAAAAFVTEGRIDPASCVPAVEALRKLAKSLPGRGRTPVAKIALGMCQAYLAGERSEIAAAKAKLLSAQLQMLLGQAAARERLKKLAEAYGGLNCKLEIVDDENVRVTYNFSDEKQMMDWRASSGTWAVGKGVLAAKTRPYRRGQCSVKLRFRADRPFKLAFDGTAKYELAAWLQRYPWRSLRNTGAERFSLRRNEAAIQAMGVGWSDGRYRVAEGTKFHFEIITDGKGGFVWSVNNVVIYRHAPEGARPRRLTGSFVVQLGTESSDRSLSIFDNVVIEGAILPEPLWSPPPAAKQPAEPTDPGLDRER